MTLEEYLKKNHITITGLSKDLGVTMNYIWMVVKKRRVPSEKLAKAIVKWTNNQVAYEEIRNNVAPKLLCPTCGRKKYWG